MAAARYWRAVSLVANDGGNLALTSLFLYSAGVRVDGSATLTSSSAPAVGSLSSIQDADQSSGCEFSSTDVFAPGFQITWDFGGSPVDVTSVAAAGVASDKFLRHLSLQSSSDKNTWSDALLFGQFAYPGSGTLGPQLGVAASFSSPSSNGVAFSKPTAGASKATAAFSDSFPSGLPTTLLAGANNLRDMYLAGRGSVVGTVKEKGTPSNTPVYRRVRLFRDRDGLLVAETWSNPTTGAYAFANIDENETYTALSYDHTGNFRAVAADKLVPTVP